MTALGIPVVLSLDSCGTEPGQPDGRDKMMLRKFAA